MVKLSDPTQRAACDEEFEADLNDAGAQPFLVAPEPSILMVELCDPTQPVASDKEPRAMAVVAEDKVELSQAAPSEADVPSPLPPPVAPEEFPAAWSIARGARLVKASENVE